VEAAPEFSLEPKTWWYPALGRLSYRGYFSERGATNYAAWLRTQRYDVFVGGVEAYSTLGWFKDPVLNTFLFDPEPELAETLFHELGHQRLFAGGDTDFDEAFATTVGQEGARRWLRQRRGAAEYERYVVQLGRTEQFTGLVMGAREELARLYGDERTKEGALKAGRASREESPGELRRRKQRVLDRLREDYRRLKAQWGGDDLYDGWFARPMNNAQINSVATYYHLVPGFERLLALNGGDLEKFYGAAQRLAKEPKAARHARLKELGMAARAAAPADLEAGR
jgi:predicted aminopeptidase